MSHYVITFSKATQRNVSAPKIETQLTMMIAKAHSKMCSRGFTLVNHHSTQTGLTGNYHFESTFTVQCTGEGEWDLYLQEVISEMQSVGQIYGWEYKSRGKCEDGMIPKPVEFPNQEIIEIEEVPIDLGDAAPYFSHLFEREAQISIVLSAVDAARSSGFTNRFHTILTGKPGCLHPNTVIEDPVDGSKFTVKERYNQGKVFFVTSLSKNGPVVSLALPPVRYTKEKMLKFYFSNGKTISVTENHLFFFEHSWRSAKSLFLLHSSGFQVLLPSILESSLKVLDAGVLHLMKKLQDFQESCQTCFRFCDEPPLCPSGTFQEFSLQSNDVPGYSHCCLPKDDLNIKQECTRFYQLSFPLSKKDCLHLSKLVEMFLCSVGGELVTHEKNYLKSVPQSLLLSILFDKDPLLLRPSFLSKLFSPEACAFLQHYEHFHTLLVFLAVLLRSSDFLEFGEHHNEAVPVFYELLNLLCKDSRLLALVRPSMENVLPFNTPFVTVSSIEELDSEVYYDFHVPVYNNYLAEGVWNHNCGKTAIADSIVDMVGENSTIKFDGPSCSKAGLENYFLGEEVVGPKIMIFEEIEKTDPDTLKTLLAILDTRGEVRKTTGNHGQCARDVKVLCVATANNVPLFEKLHAGALASRFTHKVYCPPPSRKCLEQILTREVEKSSRGNLAWIAPTLDYVLDIEKCTDPRRAIAVCLSGKDKLLDGSYQRALQTVKDQCR